ncbi:MAG: tagatose 1,6-diphosphate aldolase [Terriglobia bacterium]
MTPGKQAGLEAVSTERGIIAALALDQRGSLAAIMSATAGRPPDDAALPEFKAAVARALTPEVSAILLDLQYGRPAFAERAPNSGLMLAYEQDAYLNRHPERLPELIPELSVRRLKQAGANCVKLLVHYSPFASRGTNEIKKALVERVGAECRAEDTPFFLEVLGYDARGGQSNGYARLRPEIAIRNLSEFSGDQYGVDVLKIELPVDLKCVSGTRSFQGNEVYSRSEAIGFFQQAAAAARRPFIFLSAGVSHDEFVEGLMLAAEAGVPYSGVLCGRATWQDGARLYAREGLAALERWLATDGKRNIQALNECLKSAKPWNAVASA